MFNIELSDSVAHTESVEVVVPQMVADGDMQIEDMGYETGVVNGSTATAVTPSRIGGMMRNSLIIMGFLLGAVTWWATLTFVISLFRRGFRPRHMLTINRIAGVVIGALGLYTLLSVLIE